MRKALLILTCVALAACQKTENTATTTGGAAKSATVRLQGAGSTFDTPLFGKVFDAWEKAGGAQVNYQSIGSGGGVSQLTKGIVDFGASDFPLNDESSHWKTATHYRCTTDGPKGGIPAIPPLCCFMVSRAVIAARI